MRTKFLCVIFFFSAYMLYAQSWDSVGTGIGGGINYGRVFSLCVYDSELYAAGSFSYAGGNPVQSIASWNGSNWFALGTPSITAIRTTTVYNNRLYVGDPLVGAYGVSTWDGSNWQTSGSLPQAAVALGVYNNSIYASVFVNADDDYIYKLEGGSWDLINAGIDNAVNAFAVYNNELYAGGNFLTAGGDSVNKIARWNGTTWSAAGEGINTAIWCLAVHNGELYAGGTSIESFSGFPANNIAKWNGTSWSDVGGGMDTAVRALCSFNGMLYAAGDFTMAGGNPANHIAQWDGTSWSALGDGIDSTVYALCVYDSVLYAGGLFSHAGGIPASRIARWGPLSTGINEIPQQVKTIVFPNPFSNYSIITLNKEIQNATLSVYSIQGKEVSSINFSGTQVLLNKGEMASGIYFYKITSTNKLINTGKIIIQ